ncbi:hypothetical protein SAMN04487996_113157 [Dyadobacter soli]|uniref:Uncharacterized protein n=1 Tax=Dyadobacter soli TaxID=659014 RepID=A0A1G7PWS1_9BACT|nr:YIP1 family protein [Dyadobacter soli]SDF90767.1 hypothetical protein SAMN04487996_113157 [Dyadobacter soli]
MENERLFEKIKDTVLTETSGTEEYDPDKIWRDIAKKRKQKVLWLWWPYAAAIFVLCGIFIWNRMDSRKEQVAVFERAKPEIFPDVLSKNNQKLDAGLKAEVREEALFENQKAYSNRVAKKAAVKSLYFKKANDSISITILNEDSLPTQNKLTLSVSPTETATDTHYTARPETEKVLIADISIPEDKTEQYPALWQIFEQARKERQARKMRLQLDHRLRKPGLWSFVHHSFVQYPAGPFPAEVQKSSN